MLACVVSIIVVVSFSGADEHRWVVMWIFSKADIPRSQFPLISCFVHVRISVDSRLCDRNWGCCVVCWVKEVTMQKTHINVPTCSCSRCSRLGNQCSINLMRVRFRCSTFPWDCGQHGGLVRFSMPRSLQASWSISNENSPPLLDERQRGGPREQTRFSRHLTTPLVVLSRSL